MRHNAKVNIIDALRSGDYHPRDSNVIDVAFDAYLLSVLEAGATPSPSTTGFLIWIGMTDAQLVVFSDWIGCLFERVRDFDICAEAIERFFEVGEFSPKRDLTMECNGTSKAYRTGRDDR